MHESKLLNLDIAQQKHLCARSLISLSSLAQTLEAVFIFCLVWSLGAAVVQNGSVQDRDRFDKFVKNLAGLGQADTDTLPATQLPVKSLYEYCFDTDDLRWRSWKSLVQEYQVRRERKFADLSLCRSVFLHLASLLPVMCGVQTENVCCSPGLQGRREI